MKRRTPRFGLVPWLAEALLLLLIPSQSFALHFFLDTDGDGIRTTADVVDPKGTTRATLWLSRDPYKKGTSNYCSHAWRDDFDHGFSFVLQATSGTVDWGNFQPAPPRGDQITYESDDSTYLTIQGTLSRLHTAHDVRLAGITISVRRGRPSIRFLAQCPAHREHATRFSTGTWDGPVESCCDELPYGGRANRPPAMHRLADNPIRAGTSERWAIEATDADEDPLTFRLVRGPSFVSVSTLDPGHGIARGEIHITADSCSRGQWECLIEVSDGFASDQDTTMYRVLSITRSIPPSPMKEPIQSAPRPEEAAGPSDSTWLVGEWEWLGTESMIRGQGPTRIGGYRRRLMFRRDGRVRLIDMTRDEILRVVNGTYHFTRTGQRGRLTFTQWVHSSQRGAGPETFELSIRKGSLFSLYPSGWYDALSNLFVRVPPVASKDGDVDPARLLTPVEPPSVRRDRKGFHISLPAVMESALRRCDPEFRAWTEDGPHSASGRPAILGDFDGDLLPDIALLGHSGADEVVIAILTGYGRVDAKEVAWRKLRIGLGEHKTRGDPREIPPVHLETAPQGSSNPFCWFPKWAASPSDGIGIVQPGVARFDYVLSGEKFVLFAPVP